MVSVSELLQRFRITPKNYSLYERAFIHTSHANDFDLDYDYEKLEFLGDAVISMQVAEHLYRKHPDMDEGDMTNARKMIVRSETLARAAQQLGFADFIKVGGSIKGSIGISTKILEDTFESFIGAVYLDQGLTKVHDILKQTIIHYYEIHSLNALQDFKSIFQEMMQKYGKDSIKYKPIKCENNHYVVEVWTNNIKYGTGTGTKIKDAEMQAARAAYMKLSKKVK